MKEELGKDVYYSLDEKGYIMMDLTEHIPAQDVQMIDGVELLPKDEYHCSLVATRQYCDTMEQEREIAEAVREYLRTHELGFVGLGAERYLCRKEDRTTLVAPVVIDGVDELRAYVATLIPNYETPFTHVTLLKSAATQKGIGLNSLADLEQYCKKL